MSSRATTCLRTFQFFMKPPPCPDTRRNHGAGRQFPCGIRYRSTGEVDQVDDAASIAVSPCVDAAHSYLSLTEAEARCFTRVTSDRTTRVTATVTASAELNAPGSKEAQV